MIWQPVSNFVIHLSLVKKYSSLASPLPPEHIIKTLKTTGAYRIDFTLHFHFIFYQIIRFL